MLALLAGPALAQSAGQGPTLSCTALSLQIEWGLIDGGEGGDTSEVSDMIALGDGGSCLAWMGGPELAAGLWEPDCAAVLTLAGVGAYPEAAMPDMPGIIAMAIQGTDAQACADTFQSLMMGGT
jgi:hypothetical protein